MFRFSPLKWAFVLSQSTMFPGESLIWALWLKVLYFLGKSLIFGTLLLQKSQSTIFPGEISDLRTLALFPKSQSTIFPRENSDLGTLALSSRSLKVLHFLQQRFTTSWPQAYFFPLFGVACNTPKKHPNTPLLRQETARSRVLPEGSDFASKLASLSPLNLQMLEIPVSGGISGEVSRANAMVSLSFPVPKMLICQHFGGIVRN